MNTEITRPNIFDYATRELSQDAMICWLLACLHSSDKVYKDIGVDFIRFVLQDNSLTSDDVALETYSPHNQYYKMDVYAVVKARDKLIPIIFEDKTNTYLHSGQFEIYCKTVRSWLKSESYLEDLRRDFDDCSLTWGNILYVYFKTGYVPGWQQTDFKKESQRIQAAVNDLTVRTPIYIDDIIGFVKTHADVPMLSDYLEHLKDIKQETDIALNYWNDETNTLNYKYDVYSKEPACDMLFQAVFDDKKWFKYNHQGWASRDLFYVKQPGDKEENYLYYTFRLDCWEHKYAFALQQYRDEKNVSGNKEELMKTRLENAEHIRQICNEIIEKLACYNIAVDEVNTEKLHSQNNLFKFFISNENTPKKLCCYLKEFKSMLTQRISAEFGDRAVIL